MTRTAPKTIGFRRCASALACMLIGLLWAPLLAHAKPTDLGGVWYEAPRALEEQGRAAPDTSVLAPVSELSRTGGRYWYVGEFEVPRGGRYVVDFRNSTTIGQFRHRLYDGTGRLVAERVGGIESHEPNPFFLHHGREFELNAGNYRLVTELASPFLLAQPEPYITELAEYRQNIKPTNAVVLLGLGVFLGLGLYYAALAMVRRRVADAMYAFFIVGNLLYNGTALLVFPDLLGMHWFYLVSVPILFSNCAYVLFVMALLEIRPRTHRGLFSAGAAILALFGCFLLAAAFFPNWSLEFDRVGVGLFATYGLVAASYRALEGNSSARVYLVAVGAFFVLGVTSITLSRMDAHTVCVEHIGLLAVVVEVVMLALVLAHQFALLFVEKESALHRANVSIRIAYTDALTGLPNRYQLEHDLKTLPEQGSLTYIDLDGLKHYNDTYGHKRGDELLCAFSRHLKDLLGARACLFRMGGDEFAITCASGDLAFVSQTLHDGVTALRDEGFEFAGASYGSVHVHEAPSRATLKHMADTRMYEQKGQRRAMAPF